MAGKGTKLIRLGRVRRYALLERQRIADLDAVRGFLGEYVQGQLDGRKAALDRLETWLGMVDEGGGELEQAR